MPLTAAVSTTNMMKAKAAQQQKELAAKADKDARNRLTTSGTGAAGSTPRGRSRTSTTWSTAGSVVPSVGSTVTGSRVNASVAGSTIGSCIGSSIASSSVASSQISYSEHGEAVVEMLDELKGKRAGARGAVEFKKSELHTAAKQANDLNKELKPLETDITGLEQKLDELRSALPKFRKDRDAKIAPKRKEKDEIIKKLETQRQRINDAHKSCEGIPSKEMRERSKPVIQLTLRQKQLMASRHNILEDAKPRLEILTDKLNKVKAEIEKIYTTGEYSRKEEQKLQKEFEDTKIELSKLRLKKWNMVEIKKDLGLAKIHEDVSTLQKENEVLNVEVAQTRQWFKDNWWWSLTKVDREKWYLSCPSDRRKIRFDAIGDLERGERVVKEE